MAGKSFPAPSQSTPSHGSSLEVFLLFLRLGCVSFGGPIAHLGYFRKEIVERRRWCNEGTIAEVIALAQSLPGPASSQVGFALGILRAGWLGGLAAWFGFTFPSAVLMFAFAYGHAVFKGSVGLGIIHGLQLVAVAVVAQAVMAMQRSLAPDKTRAAFAILATGLTLLLPPRMATLIAIAGGAGAGLLLFRSVDCGANEHIRLSLPKSAGVVSAVTFFVLLLALPLLAHIFPIFGLNVLSSFYRSGSLVFGGGHVVLPLLEGSVVSPGWVSQQSFLAGYGAAQALPGPLFCFAAYLGASIHPATSPLLFGLLGLVGIFAPGLLAMTAVLPFWSLLRENRFTQAALRGINASVVGVLIAALYQPIWTSTIHTSSDFLIALLAFALLAIWKVSPWIVVVSIATLSVIASAV